VCVCVCVCARARMCLPSIQSKARPTVLKVPSLAATHLSKKGPNHFHSLGLWAGRSSWGPQPSFLPLFEKWQNGGGSSPTACAFDEAVPSNMLPGLWRLTGSWPTSFLCFTLGILHAQQLGKHADLFSILHLTINGKQRQVTVAEFPLTQEPGSSSKPRPC
jgi:hypothetical protein